MRRRREVSPDEKRLWRMAVSDAEPLLGREPAEEHPPPVSAPAEVGQPREARLPAKPALSPAGVPSGGGVARPGVPVLDPGGSAGVDRRTDERLRRGRFEIDARIDLHGMTQTQAHAALSSFIRAGWHERRRAVLVITGKGSGPAGKGEGVLRGAVPRWLNEAPLRQMVVAIRSAQPRHGGEGALYVLLKRRREGPP